MFASESLRIEGKPTVSVLGNSPREDWNFDLHIGSRHVYASYEEVKSLWFAMSAALSQYEDEQGMNEPVPYVPAFPPAVVEFMLSASELTYDPSFGYFTEMGGKAHIMRGDLTPGQRIGVPFSLCGLRIHSGHPRREGETPCLNCRSIALASPPVPSHRETRPKVDGEFALTQEVCLERLAKHEWRWGSRSIGGDRAVTRRYCVNCGTCYGEC